MKSDYVLWTQENVPYAAVLDDIQGFDNILELKRGVPQGTGFPDTVSYPMHPDYPTDTVLIDNMINSDMLIVASARLKDFLEARGLKQVEYLPVTIMDHKGKPVGNEYFIIHPVAPVPCLDLNKSGAKMSPLAKNDVTGVQRIVFDPAGLDPDRELFRPASFYRVILARRELAQAIDGEGFTGIRWVEPADYPED